MKLPEQPPLGLHEYEGYSFQFIQQELEVPIWDVSIQKPNRKILGQIEKTNEGWSIKSVVLVKVSKRIYFEEVKDTVLYKTWEEAGFELLQQVQQKQRDINLSRLKVA